MKRFVPVFIAALLVGLSPAAHGAPKKKPKNKATKSAEKPPPSTPKPAPEPVIKPDPLQFFGVVVGITITHDGEIEEFYVDGPLAASQGKTLGCGMKLADHPLMLWAIDRRQQLHFEIDENRCLVKMSIALGALPPA